MSALQSFAIDMLPLSVYPLPCTQILERQTLPDHSMFCHLMVGQLPEPLFLPSVQRSVLGSRAQKRCQERMALSNNTGPCAYLVGRNKRSAVTAFPPLCPGALALRRLQENPG